MTPTIKSGQIEIALSMNNHFLRDAFVRRRSLSVVLLAALFPFFLQSAESTNSIGALAKLQGVHRIIFLGDSITYAGGYVDDVEAYYVTRFPDRRFEFINMGLSSETVSGLSEPGH